MLVHFLTHFKLGLIQTCVKYLIAAGRPGPEKYISHGIGYLIATGTLYSYCTVHKYTHFQSCPSGEQKSCVSPYKVWSCY